MATRTVDENHLRCAICSDRYKDARILPCGHTFCFECLERYQQSLGNRDFTCPTCRQVAELPDGIHGLTKNFLAMNLIEDLVLNSQRETPRCNEHPTEELRYFCRECSVPICRDCAVLGHSLHERMTASDGATLIQESFQALLTGSDDNCANVKGAQDELKDQVTKIHSASNKCRAEIEAHYSAFVAKLTSDKEKLMERVHQIEIGECAPLEAMLTEISQWRGLAEDTRQRTRSLIDANNKWELIRNRSCVARAFNQLERQDRSTSTRVGRWWGNEIDVWSPQYTARKVNEMHTSEFCQTRSVTGGGKQNGQPDQKTKWLERIDKLNLLGPVNPHRQRSRCEPNKFGLWRHFLSDRHKYGCDQ